jgi:RHS repeat-associated protein
VRQYQRTDSVNYLTEATYNLNGSLATETFPSVPGSSDRRTVTYTPDSAARLASFSSSATSYAAAASVSSIGYAQHNAVKSETYGNSLVHAVVYNNRLQPTEIKLGTSSNATSILDLTYSYSDGTHGNNGDIMSLNYSGGGLSYTQTFTYDSLNRIATAVETNGGTTNWTQNNAYDRYGNRQIDYGGGGYNLTFGSTTNRITTSGYTYDSAGNLINDLAHSYGFDAVNKVATVDSTAAIYTYDGEGHRVKKVTSAENTRFIYGTGGDLVAEYDGSSGSLRKEYLLGGITIEPAAVNSNGTQYPTVDRLGSPRVLTNSSGNVASRHDYMPFGEELASPTGGRSTGMGFSTSGDTNRKKYTGYERDTETGLDFAQARFYSSVNGRFTSPDPFSGSAIIADPQTFNRYAYCRSNPVNSTDPTGLSDMGPRFSMPTSDGMHHNMGTTDHESWSSVLGGISTAETESAASAAESADNGSAVDQQTSSSSTAAAAGANAVAQAANAAQASQGSAQAQPQVVDLRKDSAIDAEVASIKGTPLGANETPKLSNVRTVVGNQTDVVNGTVIDGYGRAMQNFTGVVRPVAYIPLDQGGNLMGPGNNLVLIEQVELAPGTTGEKPATSGPAPSPPSGVFIDIQSLPKGTKSVDLVQIVVVGQFPSMPKSSNDVQNATSAFITGITKISKSAEQKKIDVTMGKTVELPLKH